MRISRMQILGALAITGALVIGAGSPYVTFHPKAVAYANEPTTTPDATSIRNAQNTEMAAYHKEQIVYIKANALGCPEEIFATNTIKPTSAGTVEDDGLYEQITNITDQRNLESTKTGVKFIATPDEEFKYQGELPDTTALPWIIEMSYTLNGQKIAPEDLGGKSGNLEMNLTITQNDNCDSVYADNYLIQVTGEFANENIKNLEAPQATTAQSGDNTQLTYMMLPHSQAHYAITAQVENFSFDGWQIVGIPLQLALSLNDSDLQDSDNKLSELSRAIETVNNTAEQISAGSDQLHKGLTTLSSSSESLTSATQDFSSVLQEINNGSQTLYNQVSSKLVPGLESLAKGSQSFTEGLDSKRASLLSQAQGINVADAQTAYQSAQEQLLTKYSQAYTQAFSSAYSEAIDSGQSPTDAKALATQSALKSASSSSEIQEAKQVLESAATNMVSAQATKSSYESAANTLQQIQQDYQPIDQNILNLTNSDSSDSIYALESGLSEIANGTSQTTSGFSILAEGIYSYTDGVDTLATSFNSFNQGTNSLANGTQQLANTTVNINQEMIDEIHAQIESFLNPEFTQRDFVNGDTTHIETVQFVYLTPALKAPNEN